MALTPRSCPDRSPTIPDPVESMPCAMYSKKCTGQPWPEPEDPVREDGVVAELHPLTRCVRSVQSRRWRTVRCRPRPRFWCTARTWRRITSSSPVAARSAAEAEGRVEGGQTTLVLDANVLLDKNLSVFL